MNILVITNQYPNEKNIYRNGFVHTRIKNYQKINKDINIFVFIRNDKKCQEYIYDGVNVFIGGIQDFNELLVKKEINFLFIHFLLRDTMDLIESSSFAMKKSFIWVHGFEALNWKRRLFNIFDKTFVLSIFYNELQLKSYRLFVKNHPQNKYIFVSDWMKKIAENDIGVNFENYEIIPNGIDTSFFKYENKTGLEKDILLIRPFNSRKYATDIAMKSLELLSKEGDFSDYKITIVGEGKYFDKDTRNLKEYSNIKFINRFVNKDEIKELHKTHGIFLCPTRQDAQGVSMCEAMASGLVPITSNNTAIPEFVSEKEGYLCENIEDIKDSILELKNLNIFKSKSEHAAKKIRKTCDLESISQKELELVKESL